MKKESNLIQIVFEDWFLIWCKFDLKTSTYSSILKIKLGISKWENFGGKFVSHAFWIIILPLPIFLYFSFLSFYLFFPYIKSSSLKKAQALQNFSKSNTKDFIQFTSNKHTFSLLLNQIVFFLERKFRKVRISCSWKITQGKYI